MMKIAGLILMAFGLVDLVGSYLGFDLWGGFIGLQLPELLWKYSSFIELGLGYFIFNLGQSTSAKTTESEQSVS